MTAAARTEVSITGMGVVSPAGCDLDGFHAAQMSGIGLVRTITAYDSVADEVRIAGEVDLPAELTLDRRQQLKVDRCTQLATAAASRALTDASLVGFSGDPERIGIVIGSGMGGTATAQENWTRFVTLGPKGMRPRAVPMGMINDAAASVAIRYGFIGPCSAISTACASGADAIVAGYQMIVAGEADVVLAGGTEAPVVRGLVSGFDRLGALTRRNTEPASASRPFSKDRDGFVLGEGAGLLVLERRDHAAARGAREHAVLRGYGRTADAHHVTMPDPDGAGAARAITRAMRSAGAVPADVGAVNAHGTGTLLNDLAESRAIVRALGADGAVVTATKSLIGHSLGGAGAVEAVATVQLLTSGRIPATANLVEPDPEIGVDVVYGDPRPLDGPLVLSNSFAFGGHNVVLAFASP